MPISIQYALIVDRGIIQTGFENKKPVTGRHIPYTAGIVIKDDASGKAMFLDQYNSESFIAEILYKKGRRAAAQRVKLQSFEKTIQSITPAIPKVVTDDASVYLENHDIEILPRERSKAVQLAIGSL